MEVLGGEPIQPLDRPFQFSLATRARRLLELHARLLGEQAQRRPEVDVLDLLDEGEVVPAFLAAVAMPQLLFRRHI